MNLYVYMHLSNLIMGKLRIHKSVIDDKCGRDIIILREQMIKTWPQLTVELRQENK